MMNVRALASSVLLAGLLLATPPATATYPGQNGRIAFSGDSTLLGDGLFTLPSSPSDPIPGLTMLTSGDDDSVSYSADGQKIAFIRYPNGYVGATTIGSLHRQR